MHRVSKLRYLPSFYEDLEEKILYIAEDLKNPKAANKLLEAVESAILERMSSPEAFARYRSSHERKYPYYRIYVKNFVIYYVLIEEDCEKIMEVRRLLYKRQNRESLI
ncbi:MAG: type II toxin-antitoxin system RelE/ParE family toxin [Synergistaceae bacterium]|nr:type II toxin-antitoxin system RelE/ParE family toxin [Synergistaceae bacterium]